MSGQARVPPVVHVAESAGQTKMSRESTGTTSGGPGSATVDRGTRLDSWKEIAAYLKRDIRTVQRWEKQEGLPVRRHVHDERSTAYAYSSDIDAWLTSRDRVEVLEAQEPTERVARPFFRRRTGVLWTAAAVALTTLVIGWSYLRPTPGTGRASTLSIVFAPLQQFREWGPDLALSPDGSTLVYTAKQGDGPWRIFVRRLDELSGRPLAGGESGAMPFFSPDGQWLGFHSHGKLMRVPIEGGAPVSIGGNAFQGVVDWSADGDLVFADITPSGSYGLFRVPAIGGSPHLISTLSGTPDETYWLTPQWLPASRAILSTIVSSTPTGLHHQLVVVSATTGERHLVIDDAKHGLYVGDGILLFQRQSAVFGIRFDTDSWQVSGPTVPVLSGVYERARGRSWAASAGALIYWPDLQSERRLAWVDRTGKAELLDAPARLYHGPRLSPDGLSIAVVIGRGETGDVWRYDIPTAALAQLTSDNRNNSVIWTPDGSWLTLSSARGVANDIYRLRADGRGAVEPLLETTRSKWPTSWTPDGRTLVFTQLDSATLHDVWRTSGDGSAPQPVLGGERDEIDGRVSPDGRWLAYVSAESGRKEVYVASLSASRERWLVSTNGGSSPVWSRSGRELFYRSGDRLISVPSTVTGTFSPGMAELVFEQRYYFVEPGGPTYDVSLDDQRFLMVTLGSSEGPDRLNVAQGWRDALVRQLR